MCFKPIKLSEYADHVPACVAEKTEYVKPYPSKEKNTQCLTW